MSKDNLEQEAMSKSQTNQASHVDFSAANYHGRNVVVASIMPDVLHESARLFQPNPGDVEDHDKQAAIAQAVDESVAQSKAEWQAKIDELNRVIYTYSELLPERFATLEAKVNEMAQALSSK